MKEDNVSSLEKFIQSLEDNEKELLNNYLRTRTYESISAKFDQILGKGKSEAKTT